MAGGTSGKANGPPATTARTKAPRKSRTLQHHSEDWVLAG
jgi:hypothetical protein